MKSMHLHTVSYCNHRYFRMQQMKLFRSLHSKILFGYAVVGLLFVVFVGTSIIQFRVLKDELNRRQGIVSFFDLLRDARRLEKNFLLYKKEADLHEAVEQANKATQLLEALLRKQPELSAEEVGSVATYRDRLLDFQSALSAPGLSAEILKETFVAGSSALRLGERLDDDAQRRVDEAIRHHEINLQRIIWVMLALGLLVGILVTRSVVRPLRELERSLQKIAKGEAGRLEGEDSGDEMASLTRSINDTLHELEARQSTMARSSRLMALGTMLSGVAHELNNPLSNISSSCQILQEEMNELPDEQIRTLLGQIDDQVMRSQRIVSALLNNSGSGSLERRSQNVLLLLDETLTLLRNQIPASIVVKLEVAKDVVVVIDRTRFQQVLINVIKNAAEAIHGEGNIVLRAWREEFPEGRGTTFEIEDDGEGIAGEPALRIFDPFYTTKPTGKGIGLGLFVASEIVTQHGGTIAAESVVSGGTRIWIHVPDEGKTSGESDV
ncbi:MAG: ATP-binding region, ATPase-like:Histidine kinase, region:Histidine kinase N-terminal [Proteobacteria bacterium]|nr:ATP-binding region, ATPase-like:Histidine kinase, region:Histidine kinase N-terminal [Pseudomonadota bacterium]